MSHYWVGYYLAVLGESFHAIAAAPIFHDELGLDDVLTLNAEIVFRRRQNHVIRKVVLLLSRLRLVSVDVFLGGVS